ncbi:MAG: ABC transporter ATP-binding protein [Thermodesulfobacteriota bacterium]
MSYILEVKQISKFFKTLAAVSDVTFSIEKGTCFGLLGPNGAGKTTLIEIIENIIPPTSGEVLYKGNPRTTAFREEVGIQFQQTALLSYLTVHETLKTFQAFYRTSPDLKGLISECYLDEILTQYNDKISGGQRQRLLLSLALINDPQLLFLDEPSTGLDPHARRNLWEIIERQKGLGRTIILTTHYMEEAERLCDIVAIMDHGRLIAMGSPRDLISTHCRGAVLSLSKAGVKNSLGKLPTFAGEIGDRIEIQTDDINSFLKEFLENGVPLSDMVIRSPNLEDVFIKLTGRKLRN